MSFKSYKDNPLWKWMTRPYPRSRREVDLSMKLDVQTVIDSLRRHPDQWMVEACGTAIHHKVHRDRFALSMADDNVVYMHLFEDPDGNAEFHKLVGATAAVLAHQIHEFCKAAENGDLPHGSYAKTVQDILDERYRENPEVQSVINDRYRDEPNAW